MKVLRIAKAIREGRFQRASKKPAKPEVYALWGDDDRAVDYDPRKKAPPPIAAPKLPLPGHASSYNPPPEYLFTDAEREAWEAMDPAKRPIDFIPRRYASLRQARCAVCCALRGVCHRRCCLSGPAVRPGRPRALRALPRPLPLPAPHAQEARHGPRGPTAQAARPGRCGAEQSSAGPGSRPHLSPSLARITQSCGPSLRTWPSTTRGTSAACAASVSTRRDSGSLRVAMTALCGCGTSRRGAACGRGRCHQLLLLRLR